MQNRTWCCLTPERKVKTWPIMRALERGWPGAVVSDGEPPFDNNPFITWGQIWLAERMIKQALPIKRPFWQIDNGFYKPARGTQRGYYRFMFSHPSPIYVRDPELKRARNILPPFKPWRKSGKHIVLAIPGADLGRAFGLNCSNWHLDAYNRLRAATDRPIRIRPRTTQYPLKADLEGAWALVTHSSNVAVDAVVEGIPVFVEPTSMAVPVGNLGFDNIENPLMPNRRDWWHSLMCQQFTIPEIAEGVAARFLLNVEVEARMEYDGRKLWPQWHER